MESKIEPDPAKNERYQKSCADRRGYGFAVHDYDVWLSWDLNIPLPLVRTLIEKQPEVSTRTRLGQLVSAIDDGIRQAGFPYLSEAQMIKWLDLLDEGWSKIPNPSGEERRVIVYSTAEIVFLHDVPEDVKAKIVNIIHRFIGGVHS